jgi:ABC-type multidrug transport system permease subunit
MLKRTLEIIAGLALAFCLIASYSDDKNTSQLMIWYILSAKTLQIITWIILFLLASRLVYGKYKDYSGYFYNLFVKMFGDPKKTKEH